MPDPEGTPVETPESGAPPAGGAPPEGGPRLGGGGTPPAETPPGGDKPPAGDTPPIAAKPPAGETPPAKAPEAAMPDGWRERLGANLPEDMKESWNNQAARIASEADVAKVIVEQRRAISKAIVIPEEGEENRAEKMGEIYDKLGRPKTADEYQLPWDTTKEAPATEADKAVFDEFKPLAHRHGLPQAAVNDIVELRKKEVAADAEATRVRAQDLAIERETTLKRAWGDDFDENAGIYNGTARHYMGEEGLEEFKGLKLDDGTYVMDHPLMARTFTSIGRDRVNDDFDYTPINASRKADAAETLAAKQKELVEKGLRPGMPNYPAEEMNALYKQVGSTKRRRGDDNNRYRNR